MTRTVTYYPVAGAMRINNTLYYILKDHLGSASVVTDANGVEVGEQRYYPFGETRLTTGTIYTDKLFTGQREMAGLGIYHYQARFYSPKLGRFLSPDTIVPGAANPQAYNRYSYVLNNPIRYNDPTGHVCSDPDDPSPSCESGNPYPNNTHPLPSGPIDPGGPLDQGLPQGGEDNHSGSSEDTEHCQSCMVAGGLIIIAMLPIEFALGLGMVFVAPTVFANPPLGLILETVLFIPEAAALNVTLVGIQLVSQGQHHSREDIHIDPLPLVHLFFPDFMR